MCYDCAVKAGKHCSECKTCLNGASVCPNCGFLKGDATGDGIVNITDAMKVFFHVAKKEFLNDEQIKRCDIDNNNTIDINDAIKIFYYVAHKTETLG